jgi:predicted regulator of Ras-like GTPase activity (Roadblock/LC7/MglB family)
MQERFDADLGQLILNDETALEIKGLLVRLLRDGQSNSAILMDQAGQIIAFQGESGGSERDQLGALIAGVFASSREVARILGEHDFHSFVHEGANENVFTESIGGRWLLAVIFGQSAGLELVKRHSSRTAIELNNVFERTLERNRLHPKLKDLGVQIVANDTIDLLFREDAEKQWTED